MINRILPAVMAFAMCFVLTSCKQNTEKEPTEPFAVIEINEDYSGPLLGVERWHINEIHPDPFTERIEFINDDTGMEFVFCTGKADKISVYLADLDNDGEPELVCNCQQGDPKNDHTYIYRQKEGVIERGQAYFSSGLTEDGYSDENYKINYPVFSKASGITITDGENYSDRFIPESGKIIMKSENDGAEYELGLEYFTFRTFSDDIEADTKNAFIPVPLTNDYKGDILGVKRWHMNVTHPVPLLEKIAFIDDDTGGEFAACYGLTDQLSTFLADIDNDGQPELVCNNQLLEYNNSHTSVFKVNNGVIEYGYAFCNLNDVKDEDDFDEFREKYPLFAEENNMTITDFESYSDKYYPGKNKIIMTNAKEGLRYELKPEHFIFEPFIDPEPDEDAKPVSADKDVKPDDIKIEYTTANPLIKDISDTEKDVTFYRDGKAIEGRLYLPEGNLSKESGPLPVVVLSCGLLQPYSDYEAKARGFADNGYAAVAYSFIDYSCAEIYSEADLIGHDDDVFLSETADLNAVLDSLDKLPGVDSGSVYLWGHSFGGLVSTYVGCVRSGGIKGIIGVEPSLVTAEKLKLKTEPPATLRIYPLMSECDKPMKIFVGTRDGFGLVEGAFDDALEAMPTAELVVIDGADHQFTGEAETKMITIASAFIAENEAKDRIPDNK